MEDWDAYRHHEGHLLGGGGSGSGPSRRASYKEGPGHLEFQTGRYQERELGEVVWKPSWSSLGGGHLPTGLQSDFKRRAASLPGDSEGAGFYKGSLDEQSGGCRNSDGSRGRVAEAPVARKRACQAEEDRGRQRSWGASRGHLVRKLRRRKEEAEEKEEEGQGEGCRDEEPGSPLCHNRSRPKAGGAEENQEKSKAPYKEEKQEGVNGLVRELVGDIRYRQLRGRRRSAIRRRSSSKKGMEEEPGGVDVEYIGADAAGGGHHVRPDVGPGPQLSASNFQPVLEAGLAEQDERPPWQRVANALLPARLALAGQGGSCVRRGDPEAQRSGTDLSWRTLQHRPEAGVGAAGLPSDDNSNRSTGGQQDSARGVEGKEPFKPPLGKETRVGEEIRGAKGKRQDKGQRQVKGKRRSSSSRRSQQRGSREEVEASPECGPWVRGHGSVWKPPIGLMGRNKSLHGLHDILQKRLASLWQISLAIVLYRFQVQRSLHFHLEQPDGSKMLQLQPLSEIGEHTMLCRFDLCRMGNLTNPESAMPIRKRLNVATTSDPLARAIHGKLCNSDHEHRQIAGSIKHEGKRMSLSTFTEKYPAKFARQVVKILLYEVPKEKPVFAMDDPPSQENNNEHPTKKRRLMSKLSPQAIAQRFADASWQTVMRRANVMAPRVGPLVIDTGEIIHEISMLCPEHEIKHVVLCRGTDRYPGPTRNVLPGSAPLRKRICIRRKHEDVVVDDEWEPWEKLTFKGLRRKGTPARVSLTIFAKAKTVVGQEIPVSEHVPVQSQSSADVRAVRSAEFEGSEPEPKRPRTHEPMDVAQRVSEPEKTESIDRHVIDLASQKHGPRFMMLKPETQAWLLKVHRNLGHPGAMKLTEFCRQLGCPSEILQAIGDLKCSTCAENQDPKIARPSSIHDHGDFGDVVAIDGITWTNKMGQQYNIYHMLDQSTLYHTAVVTRAHDAEQAIHALHQGWIQWAGPPGLLCMDAGTELNSNDFMTFLQRYSIKHRTIATEAHWQNSRIERHGAVLQSILNKMDTEEPLDSFEKVSQATALATATKNQWSRHRGYPPEVLVFGKSSRVAGSVVSDMQLPSHSLAIDDRPEGLRFREELALRERARRAFTATDNCQVLRRALVQRSRPNRGKYVQGDHVMMWRKRGEADGSWIGPLRVVLQESSHVVWITMGSKLYRVAPEHLRPLSAVEEWQHRSTINENQSGDSPSSTSPNQSIIPPHGGVQYHNLIPTEAPSSTTTANNQDVNQIPIIPNEDNPNVSVIPISDSNSEQPDGEPVPNNQDPSENVEQPPNPVEVPIPDTDDELFVEADHVFQVDNDQCWKLEIPICAQDITRWREETKPQEMAFLVSAAKRQRSEVKLSDLTAEDRERFRQAKMKEVESWISTETITKIMRNQIPKANILRSRWILTWKEVDPTADQPQQSQKMKPKARLVVLGFEDPEVSEIPRDSPTMNKLTRMLLLQYCASRKWDIQSFDVQTAFLRGSEQSNRVLGMEPPEEMRQKLKLRQDEVVQLLKGAYGRVDAPYLWFVELKKTLEELGFQASPFDPCLFHLSDPKTQETQGLIGVHVDDGLCCGNETFQNKLKQLEAKFPFGSRKMHKFVFTGLHVTQEADYTITVNQSQYVRDIHAISISRDRRCQPDTVVTEEERQALRALIGSLQYAAVNTRPDICSRLGWLQSQINKAKVSTLVEANRTLHEAKQHSNVALRIQSIPVPDLRFVAFSDASFASEKCPDSHQGMMIMSAHKCIGENRRSPINPMVWHSKKIQKVAVSTLSAEAMALAGAVDMLSWVRLFWAWICDHRCDWRQADSTLLRLPPAFSALTPELPEKQPMPEVAKRILNDIPKERSDFITTDCKSLFDLINRNAPPTCTEFRTQLQAKLIREHIQNGIQIRWVPSAAQVADALTKVMDNTMLRTCLQQGHYSLHDEHEILKARSDARTRIKWLQALNPESSEHR